MEEMTQRQYSYFMQQVQLIIARNGVMKRQDLRRLIGELNQLQEGHYGNKIQAGVPTLRGSIPVKTTSLGAGETIQDHLGMGPYQDRQELHYRASLTAAGER